MKPFKVVCIVDNWDNVDKIQLVPLLNEIYTVGKVEVELGKTFYWLIEFKAWGESWAFRPVQDIGDSTEEYIKELIKKEDLQTISI